MIYHLDDLVETSYMASLFVIAFLCCIAIKK